MARWHLTGESFRELAHRFLCVTATDAIRERLPEFDRSINHVLVYGYIDHWRGLRFKAIATINLVHQNLQLVGRFDDDVVLETSDILVGNLLVLAGPLADELVSLARKIEASNYASRGVARTRFSLDLDALRHPRSPDDIVLRPVPDLGGSDEAVSIRLEGIDSGHAYFGSLLNASSLVESVKVGGTVFVDVDSSSGGLIRVRTEACLGTAPRLGDVRAFIACISFPRNLEGLKNNYSDVEGLLDIDYLERYDLVRWTAPKWTNPGDVVLFMYAKTSGQRIGRLLKSLKTATGYSAEDRRRLSALISHAEEHYQCYGGKIFAVGQVLSKAVYDEVSEDSHFQTRSFAYVGKIEILDEPLPYDEFKNIQRLSRSGAHTLVPGPQFKEVRTLLARENWLPHYVMSCNAIPATFSGISENTWLYLGEQTRTSVCQETEFRAYYLDHLLRRLSDDGTFHKECRCKKCGTENAYADYAMQIEGRWLTVEAKLNMSAEKDLLRQCRQYCHLGELHLNDGRVVSRKSVWGSRVLIADTSKLSLYISERRECIDLANLDDIHSQEDLDSLRHELVTKLAPLVSP